MTETNDKIIGYECKHAVYTKANDGSGDDVVYVKEYAHYEDGRDPVPFLRPFVNYKRDFYVTKESARDHEEKKEWERIGRLDRIRTQQSKLIPAIGRALKRQVRGKLSQIARNPYLYGADITTPTLIKQTYREKWPTAISNNRVAVFDIETDVLHGTKKPILASITFKDRAFMAVVAGFVQGYPNVENQIHAGVDKYLADFKKARNLNLEILVVSTPGQAIVECFKRAHEWKPDFVTMWNIDFDIPKSVETLEAEGIDPAQVFSDPSVPDKFKFWSYIPAKPTKETATGKITPVPYPERWHRAECPASFFLICSMCTYRRIRLAKQMEKYGLDDVLKKHLKLGKLKFKEADKYKKLKWHEFMQANYPIEYAVYNLFDCIGVELLDEKTKDLTQVISTQCKSSEYTSYKSQPRRLVDDIYFFCRARGLIPATVSDEMFTEDDELTVDTNNWIVTLQAHLCVDNGLRMLLELPEVASHIRVHVADLDIVSTYPNVQTILNISKETTYREIIGIQNMEEYEKRMAGVNLTAATTNCVELTCSIYKAASFDRMLDSYMKARDNA